MSHRQIPMTWSFYSLWLEQLYLWWYQLEKPLVLIQESLCWMVISTFQICPQLDTYSPPASYPRQQHWLMMLPMRRLERRYQSHPLMPQRTAQHIPYYQSSNSPPKPLHPVPHPCSYGQLNCVCSQQMVLASTTWLCTMTSQWTQQPDLAATPSHQWCLCLPELHWMGTFIKRMSLSTLEKMYSRVLQSLPTRQQVQS